MSFKRSDFLQTITTNGIVEKDLRTSGFNSFEFINKPSKFLVSGKYINRPDLISYSVYNSPDYWWMICKFNGICDVFSELVSGVVIDIPSLEDLNNYIAKNTKK